MTSNIKLFYKLFLALLVLSLSFMMLVNLTYRNSAASSCELISKIAQENSIDSQNYLIAWASMKIQEQYAQQTLFNGLSTNGFEDPAEISKIGVDWNRLNIAPEFASLDIYGVEIANSEGVPAQFYLEIGHGRNRIVIASQNVQDVNSSVQKALNQRAFKQVTQRTWVYCE